MRIAFAFLMFVLSILAGWMAFDLYGVQGRSRPLPGTPVITDFMIGEHAFTPLQVIIALIPYRSCHRDCRIRVVGCRAQQARKALRVIGGCEGSEVTPVRMGIWGIEYHA